MTVKFHRRVVLPGALAASLLGTGLAAAMVAPRHVTVTATRYELIDEAGERVLTIHSDRDDEQPRLRVRDGQGALLATFEAAELAALFERPRRGAEPDQSPIDPPNDPVDDERGEVPDEIDEDRIVDAIDLLHRRLQRAMLQGDNQERRLRELERMQRPAAEQRARDEQIRRLEQRLDRMQRERDRLSRQLDDAERTIRSFDQRLRRIERGR